MRLPSLVLTRTLASPCLGREPKAKVATFLMDLIITKQNKLPSFIDRSPTFPNDYLQFITTTFFYPLHQHGYEKIK
jgi:hypothetical protein